MCRRRPVWPPGLVAAITGLVLGGCPGHALSALPDPTRPPLVHQAAVQRMNLENPQQFSVSAIKIAGTLRKAIVNNRLVGAGDNIDGGLVVEVAPGFVTIDYLSRRLRVGLLSNAVHRHPATTEAITQ